MSLSLALSLGLAVPMLSSPPDLPARFDSDQPNYTIEIQVETPPRVGPSLADRCESMRKVTQCALFALQPWTACFATKHFCQFNDEAPFPVFHVGSLEISARGVVRDLTLAVATGPFGPVLLKAEEESPATTSEMHRAYHRGRMLWDELEGWLDRVQMMQIQTEPPEVRTLPEGGEEASSRVNSTKLLRQLAGPIHLYCVNVPVKVLLDDLIQSLALPVEFDDEAIKEAGIDLQKNITVRVKGQSIRQALDQVLEPCELKAIYEAERIRITTVDAELGKLVSCGYAIGDLLHSSFGAESQVAGVDLPPEEPVETIRLITAGIAPTTWQDKGGRGRMYYNAKLQTLFIQQTAEVHQEIVEFLEARRNEVELQQKNSQRIELEEGVSEKSTWPLNKECCPAVFEQPVVGEAATPTVDWNIQQAYHEILKMVPPRMIVEVHEASKPKPKPRTVSIPVRLEIKGNSIELELVLPGRENR